MGKKLVTKKVNKFSSNGGDSRYSKNAKLAWALGVSFFAVAFFFATQYLTVLSLLPVIILSKTLEQQTLETIFTIAFPLVLIFSSVGIATLFKKISGKSITMVLGWQIPNKKAWWLTPAVLFIYVPVLILTMALLYALSPEAAQQEQQIAQEVARASGLQLVAMIIGVGILTPIAEETLFRGLLLSLYDHKLKYLSGIFLGAGLFAIAHFQLNVSIDTLFFGIGLGVLTWQTGSIYPAVFLHMLKNGITLVDIIS